MVQVIWYIVYIIGFLTSGIWYIPWALKGLPYHNLGVYLDLQNTKLWLYSLLWDIGP